MYIVLFHIYLQFYCFYYNIKVGDNMAYAQNRILELLKIFLEETDENHYITMEELARRLQADRRTIEQDIFSLQQADFDIVKKPRPKLSFALLSRKFTLEEIKLLLDCVQVSKFLSEKKTEELTKKLYSLCSHYEAAQLNGQVHRNRIKSGNESIYRHIDMIHTAISSKLLLSFQYMEYLPSRERRARHNGKRYVVYPCALIYSEENYYLLFLPIPNMYRRPNPLSGKETAKLFGMLYQR